ncbi:MAG TPA: formyltransferase family protein, partial [Leptospiraceae bacterium]|nr:formyltransferase family protein [Leptospiraceae bacterium]
FIGARPYRQAFERGVKIIGATAHFVTPDLDQGPIISQSVVPVDHSFTEEDLIRTGRDIEVQVLVSAMKLIFEERVFIDGNKTVILK